MRFLYIILFLFLHILISQNNIWCHYCNKNIISKYIVEKKNKYHPDCYKSHIQLRCDYCNEPIDGKYNISDNSNYHPVCYKNNILKKCDVCFRPIEEKYIIDFWDNVYHKSHFNQLPACESCNRIVSKGTTNGGYKINGKRHVCTFCWESVITKNSDIQKIYDEVILKLKNVGIYNLPNKIPITLVNTRNDLKRISKIRLGSIQGYTKYEFETLGGIKVSENFNIYVLSHLHETNFRAVLAHELLHVYLFQNNLDLPSDYTEGFCNLGSQLIYNDAKNKISELKLNSMFKDKDPIYGKGFIRMNNVLNNKGWEGVLELLKRKSK